MTSHSSRPYKLLPKGYRDRGSKRRVQGIRWREGMPVELWIFIVAMLIFILLVVPWLMVHPPTPIE
jgi:hypothetical protein